MGNLLGKCLFVISKSPCNSFSDLDKNCSIIEKQYYNETKSFPTQDDAMIYFSENISLEKVIVRKFESLLIERLILLEIPILYIGHYKFFSYTLFNGSKCMAIKSGNKVVAVITSKTKFYQRVYHKLILEEPNSGIDYLFANICDILSGGGRCILCGSPLNDGNIGNDCYHLLRPDQVSLIMRYN